jgi:hypothetical protein
VNTLLHLLAAYGLAFYLQQKAAWLTDPIRLWLGRSTK